MAKKPEAVEQATAVVTEPEAVEQATAVSETVYVVAKGKSLTSIKGIIGEGKVVRPEYFGGGEATFADLLKKGSVVAQ